MQWQGIEEQRIVNSGLPADRARPRTCRWSCTNDVHYLRQGDAHAARHPAVHRHRQGGQRREAAALRRRAVLPEDRRARWRRSSRTIPTRCSNTLRIAERCNVTIADGREPPAELRRAAPASRSTSYFEHVAREGFAQRLPRLQQLARDGHAAPHHRRVRAAARRTRSTMIKKMEYPGLLPDRLGLHPLRARAGHSGRAGPRLGGRQPGRLVHAHHRRRSDRLRPDLRALPQPRARVAARYRRRLLRAAPRRGDRLRHAQVRPRERRADHHLRHDEGEGGGPRRRPRARDAVRRRRQGRQADSAGARHDARQGARREPGRCSEMAAERPEGQGAARASAAASKDDAPRLGPRRRRGHRAQGRSPTTRRSTRAAATKSRPSGR